MRVVGIDFKPAPDARDRLRRLFTILAAHFAERDPVEEKLDGPADEDKR